MWGRVQDYFLLLELNHNFQFIVRQTLALDGAITGLEYLGWVLIGQNIHLVFAKKILSFLGYLGRPQLSNKQIHYNNTLFFINFWYTLVFHLNSLTPSSPILASSVRFIPMTIPVTISFYKRTKRTIRVSDLPIFFCISVISSLATTLFILMKGSLILRSLSDSSSSSMVRLNSLF